MTTFVSLFTGIGGFDLGLQRAGMAVAAQVEIDPGCRTVLAAHWPGVPRFDDIRGFHGSAFAGVDLVCGGFPCQDLSVASGGGQRSGLDGDRSGLFWELVRVIDEARPTWVFLENVPGLLWSNGGRDMGAVLGALGDCGYVGAYRVLDARYAGVAQRRRRVIIVGRLGAGGGAEVLLEQPGLPRDPPPQRPGAVPDAPRAGGGVAPAGCLGVSENQRGEVRLTPYLRQITCGGGKPGQGYPCVYLPATGVVRRLTPLECERLQGFPDHWTAPLPDGLRYVQLGNAVPVPLIERVGRRVAAVEGSCHTPAVPSRGDRARPSRAEAALGVERGEAPPKGGLAPHPF